MSWFTLFLVCYRPLADYFTTRGLCAGEPAAKAKLWQDPPRRKRAGAASSPVRSLPSSGARQEAHHRQMEPISIPGSMASPLSSQRRRHVAGAMTNTHALRGTSPDASKDIQQAYKEYERSFDELSQASAASPPLFKRRWGDGGVEDDDVSVLTAPVVHQQRRPSQRELERELVRADVALAAAASSERRPPCRRVLPPSARAPS